jgi:DNA-binding PadR family transcriptional regulator
MTRNQVFRPGELPLVLLALLADQPMNGYEVLGELGRLFGPDYKPSPGSVYPAIQALLDERLVQADKGGGNAYRLTPTGKTALERRGPLLATVEVRTGVRLRDTADLQAAIDRFAARVQVLGGKVDPAAVETVLNRAANEIESLNGGRGHDHD